MTAEDQLHGWKEIAAYLGRTVRTAQRWERRGLPIRRVNPITGGVYAVKTELQAWRDGPAPDTSRASAPPDWRGVVSLSQPVPPGRYVITLQPISPATSDAEP